MSGLSPAKTERLANNVEEIAKSLSPRPEKKGFWAWMRREYKFVIGTLLLTFISYGVNGYYRSADALKAELAKKDRELVEEEAKKDRDAAEKKATKDREQLRNLENLRLDREELQAILGGLANERNQLFMAKVIGDYIGFKGQLDQSYLLFAHRSISDLQIQRAISLIDAIEINPASKAAETKTVVVQPESVSNYFTLALLLGQNGHIQGAEYYVNDKCVQVVDKLLDEDAQRSDKKLDRAERELFQSIQLEGMTLLAIIHAIRSSDGNALSEFSSPIEKIASFDWQPIQKNLMRSSVVAIKALIAQSLANTPTPGADLQDARLRDADDAAAALDKECLGLATLPDSQFTNFVTIERSFVVLAASHLHVDRAERLRKADNFVKALEEINTAKRFMSSETPAALRLRADLLHLRLLLDLGDTDKDGKDDDSDIDKQLDDLRSVLARNFHSADPLASDFDELQRVTVHASFVIINQLHNGANADTKNDLAAAKLQLRKAASLLAELRTIDFSWSNPGFYAEQLETQQQQLDKVLLEESP